MRKKLCLFWLVFCLGIMPLLGFSQENHPINRIKRALAANEIDFETALTYKVLAIVAPQELPLTYRSATPYFNKCGTMVFRELANNWYKLSPENKSKLNAHLVSSPRMVPKNLLRRYKGIYQDQPSLANDIQTANFNIEWGPTPPAIAEWSDSNPANGTPDYIDNLSSYLETSWSTMTTTMGLDVPLATENLLFNVYVGNTGGNSPGVSSAEYGYTTIFPYNEEPQLGGSPGMAFVVMNSNYNGFPSNEDPQGTFKGAMKVTAAHEFFHAIQFAYDIGEAGWMMEMCSTWVEDEVFDSVNDYYNYLTGDRGWHIYPDVSLQLFNGKHEYGNVIFAKYLFEKYPGNFLMKELWETLDNVPGDSSLNALSTFLSVQTPQISLSNAFNEFTARNAVMDYEEGANYGGYGTNDKMFHQAQISSYPVTNRSFSVYRPDYLGSNYVKFLNSGDDRTLQLTFDGETAFNGRTITWSAAAVASKSAGGYDVFNFAINPINGYGEENIPNFGTAGTYNKIYLVCRVLSQTGITPIEDDRTPYNDYPNGVPYTFSAKLGVINISPASATIALGTTQLFTASGGNEPYLWDTSDPNVGTIDFIDNNSGLFITSGAGTCTVTARDDDGISGTSGTITVTRTTVIPDTVTVFFGNTYQFNAVGGTEPYKWSSSDPGVGDIDEDTGLFTSTGYGTCTVRATDSKGIFDDSGTITVTFTVSPTTPTVVLGTTQLFTASGGTGTYTWISSDPGVGDIDEDTGLFTTSGAGTCTVTATDTDTPPISSTSGTITVTATTVFPNSAIVTVGNTQLFYASNGTEPYKWSSSNSSVGDIDEDTGLFTAVAEGGCTVTAKDANNISDATGTIIVQVQSNGGGGGGDSGSSTNSSSSESTPNLCGAGTVAWGTRLQGKLNILRKFRDVILKRSRLGRRFTRKYYQYSPAFVNFIKGKTLLKWFLNKFLLVIIWLLTLWLQGTLLIKYLFWISFLFLIFSLLLKKKQLSIVRL